jgi:GTPase involved in cell partitioning and DNA repair
LPQKSYGEKGKIEKKINFAAQEKNGKAERRKGCHSQSYYVQGPLHTSIFNVNHKEYSIG